MTLQELIKRLTWYDLVNKLKEILTLLQGSLLPAAPIDGNQYGMQDGDWTEITGTIGTLQQVTTEGAGTDVQVFLNNGAAIGKVGPTANSSATVGDDNFNAGSTDNATSTVGSSIEIAPDKGEIRSYDIVENVNGKILVQPGTVTVDVQGGGTNGAFTIATFRNTEGFHMSASSEGTNDTTAEFDMSFETGLSFATNEGAVYKARLKNDNATATHEYQMPDFSGIINVINYRTYNGYLTQSVAVDPPIFTEFDNQINAGTWIRESEGNYSVTTPIPYVINKVLIPGYGLRQQMVLTDGVGTIAGHVIYYVINNGGFVKIFLQTTSFNGILTDIADLPFVPILHLPELRIYN